MRSKYFSFVFLALFILISGCAVSESNEGTIRLAGSTTVLPIASRAAFLFQLNNPKITIVVNPGGSGEGVKQLAANTVDIGMLSRDISQQEYQRYSNVQFQKHVIGKDAVAVAISAEIYDSGVNVLSFSQIRQIYEGKIGNWKELGGFDKDIFVIDKEKSRGTRHVFMQAVFGAKDADALGADLVVGSNKEDEQALSYKDNAIAMLSFAWLNKSVKPVAIKMKDQAIEPSKSNIITGKYPISRDLMLITDGKPKGIVKEFIDFMKGYEGQAIVRELGFVSII